MIQRFGLLVASLAAALTLASALAVAGIGPAPVAPADPVAPAAVSAPANSTEPPVQVDTVYIPASPEPQTIVVSQTSGDRGESDDHGSESEGGDD
jgi:hypothetical protein